MLAKSVCVPFLPMPVTVILPGKCNSGGKHTNGPRPLHTRKGSIKAVSCFRIGFCFCGCFRIGFCFCGCFRKGLCGFSSAALCPSCPSFLCLRLLCHGQFRLFCRGQPRLPILGAWAVPSGIFCGRFFPCIAIRRSKPTFLYRPCLFRPCNGANHKHGKGHEHCCYSSLQFRLLLLPGIHRTTTIATIIVRNAATNLP